MGGVHRVTALAQHLERRLGNDRKLGAHHDLLAHRHFLGSLIEQTIPGICGCGRLFRLRRLSSGT